MEELKEYLLEHKCCATMNKDWLEKATPTHIALWSMCKPISSFGKIVAIQWKHEDGTTCWDDENILGSNAVDVIEIRTSFFKK